jgi:hypothetical protein
MVVLLTMLLTRGRRAEISQGSPEARPAAAAVRMAS